MKKMIGLIYKDIIQMKASIITNLILDLLFVAVSIFSMVAFRAEPPEGIDITSLDYAYLFTSEVISFLIIAIITPYALVLNSVAIDEKSDFTRFILASGCSRKLIVNEKMLFGLFSSIPSLIFLVAVTIILLTSGNPYLDAGFTFGIVLYSFFSILFLISLSLLYSSIFSSISNQAIGTIIFMIIGGLLFGGIFLGMSFIGTNTALYFFYGAAAALLALVVGGYFATIKIYEHKDF